MLTAEPLSADYAIYADARRIDAAAIDLCRELAVYADTIAALRDALLFSPAFHERPIPPLASARGRLMMIAAGQLTPITAG